MASAQKYNLQNCGHVCRHWERSANNYSNDKIDNNRSTDNYNLAPHRQSGQLNYIKEMLNTIHHVNRKDLVVCTSWIITCPQDVPSEEEANFFKAVYQFVIDRYGKKSGLGEDVCISAYVHNDETTPHIHIALLPIIIDSKYEHKFCAKKFLDRNELRSFHDDLQNHLDEQGIFATIKNNATQRDTYGRALTVHELKKNYEYTIEWENGGL